MSYWIDRILFFESFWILFKNSFQKKGKNGLGDNSISSNTGIGVGQKKPI